MLSHRSSWTPRLLAALGGAASVALVLLARVDLGDPEGATRSRLLREADAEMRLFADAWEQRLRSVEAPAPGEHSFHSWALLDPGPESVPEAPSGDASPDPVDEALLLLAQSEYRSGNLDASGAALERLMDSGNPTTLGADAWLLALRLALAEEEPVRLRQCLRALEALPWGASTLASSRLKACLVAAPHLEDSEREQLAAEVRAAFAQGTLGVQAPDDRIHRDGLSFAVVLDREWLVLRELVEERLPLGEAVWPAAFQEGTRTTRLFEAALGPGWNELPSGRWHLLRPKADSDWGPSWEAGDAIALRMDGDRAQIGAVREAALRATVRSLLDGPGDWSLGFDGDAQSPAEVLGSSRTLAGVAAPLLMVHANPGALARKEHSRLRSIRLALGVLAALIALATWLGVRALQRSARLDNLRSAFMASVSHDLRTPLASISNLAENLEDGVVVGDHAMAEYHAAIRREAGRLERMVQGLLDFASIERGKGPRLNVQLLDTDRWLGDLERAASGNCSLHGLRLRAQRGTLPEQLWIDGDSVQRAVLNLVENAVRHSGSELVVLETNMQDGDLVLRVTDQGPGLAASVREQLFAPYASSGEQAGTGLGLTIVRSIAEAHGGSAQLESGEGGRGLVATLRIAPRPTEGAQGTGEVA